MKYYIRLKAMRSLEYRWHPSAKPIISNAVYDDINAAYRDITQWGSKFQVYTVVDDPEAQPSFTGQR